MKNKTIFPFLLMSIIIAAFLCAWESFYIVEPGFTALQIRLGKLVGQTDASGAYFKLPFVDSIIMLDTRVRKANIETTAMSKDLQSVSIGMVINFKIADAAKLYQAIGLHFEDIIINPFTQESVKAVVAKFTAEDLIQKRHEAKEFVIQELGDRLKEKYITLVDFNFTHLDFSKEFIHAVEEKQIAEQSAKKARNLTEKVKEEAVQARMRAEAEAFTLKIKKESVTPELIKLQELEVQAKAIEKWNGILPHVTGSTIPLMPLLNK